MTRTVFISLLSLALIPSGVQAVVGLGGVMVPEMGRETIVAAAVELAKTVVVKGIQGNKLGGWITNIISYRKTMTLK